MTGTRFVPPKVSAEEAHDRYLALLEPEQCYPLHVGLITHGQGDVIVYGSEFSADTLRLKQFLSRNGHPYRYIDVERDADRREVITEAIATIEHAEPPGSVQHPPVAGMQPAVFVNGCRSSLGIIVIAVHRAGATGADLADLADRHQRAHLVVRPHDRDEGNRAGVAAQGILHCRRSDPADAVHRKPFHAGPLGLLEPSDGVEDRVDFRQERRDCVGEGADCRSENRQDLHQDRRDRADDR